MKNSRGPSVQCRQLGPEQALVLPNRLKQLFRRRRFVLAQGRGGITLRAPLSIKVLWKHLALLLRASFRIVKPEAVVAWT
jgi:hypothetical protein